MIDDDLLSILACPETKKNLILADQGTVDKVNTAIMEEKILNKQKEKVKLIIDGGLFRVDDKCFMYPIRKGIPLLLIEELMDVRFLTEK